MLLVAALSVQAQHGRPYVRSAAYYPRVQAAVSISTPFMQLSWGGNPYYYNAGAFYRPYGGRYQRVAPPFGIRVNVLPRGYNPVIWGGNPYYYYDGVFYRPNPSQQDYEVVQAPVGAEVAALPRDAKTMVIDGERYYSVNGTYFKDAVRPNGEIWYRVVGKHGVLNTARNDRGYEQQYPQQYPQQQYPQQQYPQQYPQQQYPQQYPSQQYPQQAPQQEYPQQYPSRQYPQIPQPQPQRQPQVAPPQEQQYPAQEDAQPAPAPRAVMPEAPRAVRRAPQQTEEQGSLPPAQNGSREAVRRGQVTQGEVKKDADDMEEDEDAPAEGDAPDIITHENPNVGWVVDKLPADCKTVMIKNKKYFVAPNGIYYEEYIDGRQVRYKVAAKDGPNKKD